MNLDGLNLVESGDFKSSSEAAKKEASPEKREVEDTPQPVKEKETEEKSPGDGP